MPNARLSKRGRTELTRGIGKISLGALAAVYAITCVVATILSPLIFLFATATMLAMAWVLLGIMTFGVGFLLPLPTVAMVTPLVFGLLAPTAFICSGIAFAVSSFLLIRSGVQSCKKAHRIKTRDRQQTTEGRPLIDEAQRRLPNVATLRISFFARCSVV